MICDLDLLDDDLRIWKNTESQDRCACHKSLRGISYKLYVHEPPCHLLGVSDFTTVYCHDIYRYAPADGPTNLRLSYRLQFAGDSVCLRGGVLVVIYYDPE